MPEVKEKQFKLFFKISKVFYLPNSFAKTTSGTVVMLITSHFQDRNKLLSALVENLGPSMVTTVPLFLNKSPSPDSVAA